jgi:hypothetical protein
MKKEMLRLMFGRVIDVENGPEFAELALTCSHQKQIEEGIARRKGGLSAASTLRKRREQRLAEHLQKLGAAISDLNPTPFEAFAQILRVLKRQRDGDSRHAPHQRFSFRARAQELADRLRWINGLSPEKPLPLTQSEFLHQMGEPRSAERSRDERSRERRLLRDLKITFRPGRPKKGGTTKAEK